MKKNRNAVLHGLPPTSIAGQIIIPKSVTGIFAGLWILVQMTSSANALYITDDLEILRIPDVESGWTSVSTQNSYTSSVVVCTYNLPSDSDNESVVRVQNAGSSGFQVRIQQPENSSSVTVSDVYCLVADDGDYTMPSPDGRIFEAHRVESDGTNGQARSRGWMGPMERKMCPVLLMAAIPQAHIRSY